MTRNFTKSSVRYSVTIHTLLIDRSDKLPKISTNRFKSIWSFIAPNFKNYRKNIVLQRIAIKSVAIQNERKSRGGHKILTAPLIISNMTVVLKSKLFQICWGQPQILNRFDRDYNLDDIALHHEKPHFRNSMAPIIHHMLTDKGRFGNLAQAVQGKDIKNNYALLFGWRVAA